MIYPYSLFILNENFENTNYIYRSEQIGSVHFKSLKGKYINKDIINDLVMELTWLNKTNIGINDNVSGINCFLHFFGFSFNNI